MKRRPLMVFLGAAAILTLASCGSGDSDDAERALVLAATPTSVPTTAPLALPTSTPAPAPTSTALPEAAVPEATVPEATPTPLPEPTVAATAVPEATLTATLPVPTPTTSTEAPPAPTAAPTVVDATEVLETPTPLPTSPTVEQPEAEPSPTPVAETPTAVVATSGEPPLECFDRDVQVYRAFVDGVDALSFEGGRVFCSGAGTNAVSAAASYRHSSGLIVQRNADFIFNETSTAYIPYSGSLHFCMNGQPASAPVRADTVPALLVVIDAEAQRQLAQGATGPASFTGSGAQC